MQSFSLASTTDVILDLQAVRGPVGMTCRNIAKATFNDLAASLACHQVSQRLADVEFCVLICKQPKPGKVGSAKINWRSRARCAAIATVSFGIFSLIVTSTACGERQGNVVRAVAIHLVCCLFSGNTMSV